MHSAHFLRSLTKSSVLALILLPKWVQITTGVYIRQDIMVLGRREKKIWILGEKWEEGKIKIKGRKRRQTERNLLL